MVPAQIPTAPPTDIPEPTAAPEVENVDQLDFIAEPNFGTIDLSAGVLSDPILLAEITSGGSVDVSYLESGCVGFASSQPNIRVNWAGFGFLRFFFMSDNGEDTTLIINGADSSWSCNDDSFETVHPSVDYDDAGSGQYDIWVGSFSEGFITGALYASLRGEWLFFSQISSKNPTTVGP